MENTVQKYKARRDTEDKIGFLGALLGLAVSPWETTQLLLSKDRPRYIFRFSLLLFIILFGPAIYYLSNHSDTMYQPSRIYNYLIAYIMFLVFFALFMSTYLFVLGIEFSFSQLLAIVAYCLTPFISLFLILYAFHYIGAGNLDFMHAVAQGHFKLPQAYAKIIPYLVIITQFSIYFIIAFSIRSLAEGHMLSALIYGLIAILPITVAAFSTAYLSNIFNPGSKELVFSIINSQISVWGY